MTTTNILGISLSDDEYSDLLCAVNSCVVKTWNGMDEGRKKEFIMKIKGERVRLDALPR